MKEKKNVIFLIFQDLLKITSKSKTKQGEGKKPYMK